MSIELAIALLAFMAVKYAGGLRREEFNMTTKHKRQSRMWHASTTLVATLLFLWLFIWADGRLLQYVLGWTAISGALLFGGIGIDKLGAWAKEKEKDFK